MKYDDTLLPFLALMRAELTANVHKGDRPGWLSMSAEECMAEINYHVGKLHWALRHSSERGMAEVVEFSADVANCCMMLLDTCGALAYAPQPPAGGEPEVLAVIHSMYGEQEAFAERELVSVVGLQNRKIGTELIDRANFTALQTRLQAAEARVLELDRKYDGALAELQAVIDTGALTAAQHESLEAEICARIEDYWKRPAQQVKP